MNNFKIFLFLLFLLFSFNSFSQNKNSILDSLITIVKTQVDDTIKVDNLNTISKKLGSSDFIISVEYAKKALKLANILNYKSGEALANKNIGNAYYFKSDYTNAYEFYNKSLYIYKNIENKKGTSILIRNLGSIFHQQGDYKKALDYFFKSLDMRLDIDDKKGIASLYNAIGLVFFEQEKFLKSSKYYHKSLEINKKLDNKMGIANCYYRISSFYSNEKLKKFDKALEYSLKFLALSQDIANKRLIAQANELVGIVYIKKKKYDKAIINLNKSKILWKETGNFFGLASTHYNIGKLYFEIKNYDKSVKELEKALEIVEKIKAPRIEKDISETLTAIYDKLGNHKKAFQFHVRYMELKDSLINEERSNAITRIEMNMQFDKQLKKNEFIQKQKDLKSKERLKRQQLLLWFFITGFILTLGLSFFIFKNYRAKKMANALLEDKNLEIIKKNLRLTHQKEEIEKQKEEIEEQKKNITDSILYAKRIQTAVLSPDDVIEKEFSEYFIFFKPRNIVSGDFYWMSKKDNLLIVASADCTGHGVPGAFMSMLGVSFLNEIVNKKRSQELKANLILNELREHVKTSLRQTGKRNEAKDGMDIALCVFDFENLTVQYSGAYNPMILIRDQKIIQYKADRMPIGIYIKEKPSFTNNVIEVKKDDRIYIFSDGFPDQFGGIKGKKFLIKNFKIELLKNSNETMIRQKEILDEILYNWKNPENGKKFEQIDDILIIGLKI